MNMVINSSLDHEGMNSRHIFGIPTAIWQL